MPICAKCNRTVYSLTAQGICQRCNSKPANKAKYAEFERRAGNLRKLMTGVDI